MQNKYWWMQTQQTETRDKKGGDVCQFRKINIDFDIFSLLRENRLHNCYIFPLSVSNKYILSMIVYGQIDDSHQSARISHVFAFEGINTPATTQTLWYELKKGIVYNLGCSVLSAISSKLHPISFPLLGGKKHICYKVDSHSVCCIILTALKIALIQYQ